MALQNKRVQQGIRPRGRPEAAPENDEVTFATRIVRHFIVGETYNNLLILSKRLSSVRGYLHTGVFFSHFDFVEILSDALIHRQTL
jgi:hypothetical protein